jgi:hypothetical protein
LEPLSIPEGSFQALLAQPQRRGLYVYDAAPDGLDAQGRGSEYKLVAAPMQPLTLEGLPTEFRQVVARVAAIFGSERVNVEGI